MTTNVDATRAQGPAAPTPGNRRTGAPRQRMKAGGFHGWFKWHYVVLVIALLISAFPFYWMFVGATNTNAAIRSMPPALAPGGNFGQNASVVFERMNFWQAFTNSVIVSSTITISTLFFCTLAGFAFAKMTFKGRNALMTFVVLTITIPLQQLGLIPLFMLMARFGWVGELRAIIVPGLVSAFGVFWMRQVCVASVHDELLEAGRVDGCSMFRLFRHVVVPSVRSGAAVLGLFTFLFVWNDFLWPLVVLRSVPANHTLQVALRALNDAYYTEYTVVITGVLLSTLPLILVFFLFSRQMIAGVMEGAVKG
jgi:cellobiose transport system permease protein